MKDFDTYQRAAARTAKTPQDVDELIYGLAGEVGEIIDYLKKVRFHGHVLDREWLRGELGDAQWYLSQLAGIYGLLLSDIAAANLDKLRRRYPDGFDPEKSRQRKGK